MSVKPEGVLFSVSKTEALSYNVLRPNTFCPKLGDNGTITLWDCEIAVLHFSI